MNFRDHVLSVVSKIPRGSVLSYKEVAKQAGNPKAMRAVGNILKQNTNTDIPCHRVIRSDGSLGAYNGLLGRSKEKLLKDEGVL